MNIPTPNTKAQAHTIEAILGVGFLVLLTFFIAPSISSPAFEADTEQQLEKQQAEEEIQQLITISERDGTLKSSVLHNEIGIGNTNETGEPERTVAPVDRIEQHFSLITTGDLNIYVYPEDTTETERYAAWEQREEGNVIASKTTTVVLYDHDYVQSPPESFSKQGTASPQQFENDEDQLENIDPDEYYIDEGDTTASSIYNVVTVRFEVVE